MQRFPIAIESVKNLQPGGKRLLEDILGQPLDENQKVFILVFSPGKEPEEEACRQARAGLEATFQKTAARAEKHGIADEEIDAAIGEAMHIGERRGLSPPWAAPPG
jgi:hypothetical protein